MRLINSSFEILEQAPGIEGVYKQVEKAARVCYKSESRTTDDSYKQFLRMLYDRGHGACFEQGTVYLYHLNSGDALKHHNYFRYSTYNSIYSHKEVCQSDVDYYNHEYVTTNLRVLLETGRLDDLKYICEPTEHHEKRICVKFTLSNGIAREFCRHRVFSFMMESTRYCNYSQDRFSNDITYIIPSTLEIPEGKAYWHDGINYRVGANPDNFKTPADFGIPVRDPVIGNFIRALDESEKSYMNLIKEGQTPQVARDVLPLALKTELVMTGTISQWKGFFKLRTDNSAHPDARALAIPLQEEFIRRGYIKVDE